MKFSYNLKPWILLLLAMGLFSAQAIAQNRTITGTITSAEDGEALIGVNVLVKGTSTGTITDFDGKYSIEVPEKSTLNFSYVGYATQEVEVGMQSVIDIVLAKGELLDEIVVTALGISREKKALGYAVSEVGADEIENSGQNNLVNALQGTTPGVYITRSSGTIGGGSNVLIRGITSLDPSRSNAPLYVIDGIEISDDTDVLPITSDKVSLGLGASSATQGNSSNRAIDIDPSDIESMTVLKGASATALYGVRAANGAIVITTKKGASGAPRVDIGYSYGWEEAGKVPNAQQTFIDGHRDDSKKRTWVFYNWGPEHRAESDDQVYDVYRDFFQTGVNQTINASVTAGTDRFNYRLSGSYFDGTGIIPNTNYTKKNFSLSASYKVSDRFKVDASAIYANTGGNKPHEGRKSTINNLMYTPNVIDMTSYDEPYTYGGNFSSGIIDHALFVADNNTYVDDVNRLLANIKFKYDISDNISLNYALGVDNYDDQRQRNVSPETDEGNNMHGFVVNAFVRKSSYTSNLFAKYSTSLGSNLGLSVILGHYLYSSNKSWSSIRGENLAIDNFYNLYNTSELFQSNSDVRYRNMALYGELAFDYDDFLYLSITGRNDYTSSLPTANNSYFFPSFNLSWVLSDMVDMPEIVSFAKLRASYAIVGKDAGAYQIGRYYGSASNFPFNNVLGYGLSTSIGDNNLKPEFSKSLEFGAELRLLKNRLGFDVSYYTTKLEDMILSVPISNATGAARYLTNAGSMQTKGLELVVDFTPIKTDNFKWNSAINWSTNEGEVLEISEDIGSEIVLASQRNVVNKYVVGGLVGDLYGNPFNRTENGDLIIESDGYPRVNYDTTVLMGNAFPDFIASWQNTFNYKGIGLSMLWEWKKGGKIIDVARTYSIGNGQLEETNGRYRSVVMNGVMEDADGNYVTNTIETEIRPTEFYRNWRVYRYAPEVYLEDASWFRLRNISLSYALPAKMLENVPLSNVKISVIGSNLFLNTPFKGFDPELNYFGGQSNIYGYTGLRTPSTKSWLVKLNLTF